MTALASPVVDLAAGLLRICTAGEGILLCLGNISLRHQAWQTAQQARDHPGDTASPRILNRHSSIRPQISISVAFWGGAPQACYCIRRLSGPILSVFKSL